MNALRHLQEITSFFRVLGSYPRGGQLLGLGSISLQPSPLSQAKTLFAQKKLGIIGFGNFGQFLARRLVADYDVHATSRSDYGELAGAMGVHWHNSLQSFVNADLDIIVVAVSVLSFENQLRQLAVELQQLSPSRNILIVDVLSVKVHAKNTMLALLPEWCDILCTHAT